MISCYLKAFGITIGLLAGFGLFVGALYMGVTSLERHFGSKVAYSVYSGFALILLVAYMTWIIGSICHIERGL